MKSLPQIEMGNVATLKAALAADARVEYLFFWSHRPSADGQIGKGCLSQWWPAPFEVENVTYLTAEHFMMAEKARLFGDPRAREQIVATAEPAAAKKLGRGVQGFDEQIWQASRFEIVVRGNQAKFSQHEALAAFLHSTAERVLVEASLRDRIWGIGLAERDPRAAHPEQWLGLNLLGFALMQVRTWLGPTSARPRP